jgi:RHS repeat-associated protein
LCQLFLNIKSALPLLVLFLSCQSAFSQLPACLTDFAFYSTDGSVFKDRDSIASGNIGSNKSIEFGIDSKSYGNLVAGTTILLRDRAKVYGNVTSGAGVTMHSGAQVTGTTTQYASVPACNIPQETFSVGSQDHSIYAGNTLSLNPGSYRDIRIYGNGTLKLKSGKYYLKTLITEADGKFLFNTDTGTIQIFVSNLMSVGDRSKFNFVSSPVPEKIKFHSQQTSTLYIGTDLIFWATLVAPLAQIHSQSRTTFHGAVYGKSLLFEPDIRIFEESYFQPPTVTITSPAPGFLTKQSTIPVTWKVNGTTQTSQASEVLDEEGSNSITRCFGGVCATVNVIRDQTAPVVAITSPASGFLTKQNSVPVAWTIDGVTQTAQTTSTLVEGSNTITRTATDAAGNTATVSVTVTRDTQAPVVIIQSPTDGQITNQSPITVAWSVDGSAQTTQVSESLVDGTNTISRSATDVVGNVGSATVSVTLDTHAPVVAITSPANGLVTNQSSITVAWTIDGVAQTTQTSATLVEGINTITRTATDAAGNTATVSISVTRDTQAPVVSIESPINGLITNQSPITVAWSVDGTAQTTQVSETLVDGTNTISRSATDVAGNVGSAIVSVTLDTQSPVITITSPANGFVTNQSSITVAWTIDGVAQTTQTSATLVEGINTITRSATDAAGNTATVSVTVTHDTQAPVVTIQSPIDGQITNQSPITVAWSVDGTAQTTQVSESLVDGTNTISRSATDVAGNVGSATVSVTLDTHAPVVAITSPANGLVTNQSSITVAWTIDGVAQTTQTSATLVEGINTITRSATDAAGNTATVSVTVTHDTQAPVVTIQSPIDGQITNQSPITVAWSVDGTTQTAQISETLVEGTNTISRSATDVAGNVGSATVSVTLDTQAPVIAITSPANGFVTNQSSITVVWTIDGVAQTTQTSATLVEGSNAITRTATDAAGNTATTIVTVIRTTQNQTPVPVVVITSPNDGAITQDKSIQVEWTVDGVAQPALNEPLATGLNEIHRYWTNENGQTGHAKVLVVNNKQPTQMRASAIASTPSGGAPHSVEFTGWGESPNSAKLYKWDFDGDGIFDTIQYVQAGDQMVFHEVNFESGLHGWTPGGNQGSIAIARGGQRIGEGPENLVWSIQSDYSNHVNGTLISPEIFIPTGGTAQLSWDQDFKGEYNQFVYGYVEVEQDGNNTGLQTFYGNLGNTHETLDLSAFAGQSIKVRFRFFSYYAWHPVGWTIDNIRLTSGAEPNEQVLLADSGEGLVAWENSPVEIQWTLAPEPKNHVLGNGVHWLEADTSRYDYQSNLDAWITSPKIGLPSSGNLGLTFWQYLSTETNPLIRDGGFIEISANDGPFEKIEPNGNYPANIEGHGSGYAGQLEYSYPIFDLSSFAGDSVRIRFHFVSDDSGTRRGWLVDDIRLYQLSEGLGTPFTRIQHTYLTPGEYQAQFEMEDFWGSIAKADSIPLAVHIGPAGAPEVEIWSPNNGLVTNQNNMPVVWAVNDIPQTTDTSESLTVEGRNSVTRTFTDTLGRISIASRNVYRDTEKPEVVIDWPENGYATNWPELWVYYHGERGYGNKFATLTEGENKIAVHDTDEAGNIGSDTIRIVLDRVPPVVTIVSPAADTAVSTEFISIGYVIDGMPYNETRNLELGPNEIVISGNDGAGNVASDTVVITRYSYPIVSISSPIPSEILDTSVVRVYWSVDGVEMNEDTTQTLVIGSNLIKRCYTNVANLESCDSISVVYKNCLRVSNETIHFTLPETRNCIDIVEGGILQADSLLTVDTITILSGGSLIVNDSVESKVFLIKEQGLVTHSALTHENNSSKVNIHANEFNMESGSILNVSGKGYPSGYGPLGQINGTYTSGGSHAGKGNGGTIPGYDDYRQPTMAGGGGAAPSAEQTLGAGGGVVRIQANSLVLNGSIQADGQENYHYGTGAGGSIWISTNEFVGAGALSAKGEFGLFPGSGGRIAIYANTISNELLRSTTTKGFSPGTIFWETPAGLKSLVLDSGSGGTTTISEPLVDTSLKVTLRQGSKTHFTGDLKPKSLEWESAASAWIPGQMRIPTFVQNSGTVEIGGDSVFIDSLVMMGPSKMTSKASTPDTVRSLVITSNTLSISDSSKIDVSGKGYPVGFGPNGQANACYTCGGSHAGKGMNGTTPGYGYYRQPSTAGGGGSNTTSGQTAGAGGGIVRIQTQSLILNGSIKADGEYNYFYGTGAGGSIWIHADEFSGNGKMTAKGDTGSLPGSGGRIAIYGCGYPLTFGNSVNVGGFSPGTFHFDCMTPPTVQIHFPENNQTLTQTQIPVIWSINDVLATTDTNQTLVEGRDTVIRCATNSLGLTGCDTAVVRVDFTPNVVKINYPLDSTTTKNDAILVNWTINGYPQIAQTSEALAIGRNQIIRSYADSSGSFAADTVTVFRDTTTPTITLISPDQRSIIVEPQVSIRWAVNGVEQSTIQHIMDRTQKNSVKLAAFSQAGVEGSLLVELYPGILVPEINGQTHQEASIILEISGLIQDTTWVDTNSVATGIAFNQSPMAGDTIRMGFPVKYSIGRGVDAVDIAAVGINADSIHVDPNTLQATGSSSVSLKNIGRATIGTASEIIVFEDKNNDHLFDSTVDLTLGAQEVTLSLNPMDSIEIQIPVSGQLTFNGNRLNAFVDAKNQILEYNEENNLVNSMASCRKTPDSVDYTPQIKWAWRDTAGWQTNVLLMPLVARINDDNGDGIVDENDIPDVIVSAYSNATATGKIVVLDGISGRQIWSKSVNAWGRTNPAIGDIDNDGKPEIVFEQTPGDYGWNRRITILDNEGNEKFSSDWIWYGSLTIGSGNWPAIHDLDGDGQSEITFANNIFDNKLNLIYPNKFNPIFTKNIPIDNDFDGYQDLYGNDFVNNQVVFSNIQFKSRSKITAPNNIIGYPMVVGFETNDSAFIISEDTKQHTNNHNNWIGGATLSNLNGTLKTIYPDRYVTFKNHPHTWESPIDTRTFLDGSGDSAFLFRLGNMSVTYPYDISHAKDLPFLSKLNLFDSSYTYKIYDRPDTIFIHNVHFNYVRSTGTLFDFNDDGKNEFILSTMDSILIVDQDFKTLSQISVPTNNLSWQSTVADVDLDGHADLVVGMTSVSNFVTGQNGIVVYSNPTWVGARSIFNQTDYSVTNVNDDGSIPKFPTPSWKANNTFGFQCAEGHYACADISASFPQITGDNTAPQMKVRIGNGGAIELPKGMPITLYGQHLGIEDTLQTVFTPERMKPGTYQSIAFDIPQNLRGLYKFRIVADDSGNGHGYYDESNELNNSVQYTFLVRNKKPILQPIANQSAELNQSLLVNLSALDEDNDPIQFSLVKAPAGMTIHPNTGEINWIPTVDIPRCTVTVRAFDEYQGEDEKSFLVFMGQAQNQPPTITSTPGTTAELNTFTSLKVRKYQYLIQATDDESGSLEYDIAQSIGPDGRGPGPILTGNLLFWLPMQPMWRPGDTLRIQLKVTDIRGESAYQWFTIHLTRGTNSPPAFGTTPVTVAVEDQLWKMALPVFDFDEDSIRVYLDSMPPGMVYRNDSLFWTPTRPDMPNVVRIGAFDGIDTTWLRFGISITGVNDAPIITSKPDSAKTIGALFHYTAKAVDADSDAVTFSLSSGPSGSSISSDGLLSWDIPNSFASSVTFDIRANDGHGGVDSQAFVLRLKPDTTAPNLALQFSHQPTLPNRPVTVSVLASDEAGLGTQSLTQDGLSVALTNSVYTFIPTDTGKILFEAIATDPFGNTSRTTSKLVVSANADDSAPIIQLSHSPSQPQAGETVQFSVQVTDNVAVDASRIWIEVDGQSLPVQNGSASYTVLRPGTLSARAYAYDSIGNMGTASDDFLVSPLANDTVAPVVEIISPFQDTVITGMISVIGTASDAHLAYYTFSYRDIHQSTWVEYARFTTNVEDDYLGAIDGTNLPNGDYEIRVQAFDRSGNSHSSSVQVQVTGERKVGPFTLAFNDLTIPMSGLDLTLTRSYDSRDKSVGEFGYGWKMGMHSIALHENANQGTNWTMERSPGLIPQYSFNGSRPHTVTVTLPGGRKQEFEVKVQLFSPFDPSQGRIQYVAKPGTYSKLKALDAGDFLVMGGELYDINGTFGEPYNPQRYQLTLLDGSYFIYDQDQGGVVESGDANGNRIQYADGHILHTNSQGISNKSLNLVRDAEGRIQAASDESGRGYTYAYDVLGNLSVVVDPEGHITRFKYGPNHYLSEIVDPRGVKAVRTEYDGDGRMVRQINANGDTLAMNHDVANNREEVVDFNGNQTSFTYDAHGNVLSKTDDQGQTWTYEYDALHQLIATYEPGGSVKRSSYDANGNEIASTDELNQTTYRTYTSAGKLATMTDALGRTTRYTYDVKGNLLEKIGPDGKVQSVRTYDAQGNVLTEKDALGYVSTQTYTPEGWLKTQKDALNRVTRHGYDQTGHTLFTVNPTGDTTHYRYDDLGNVITTITSTGDTTRTVYNAISKVVSQTDALGHSSTTTYNALGDKAAQVNADGAVTTYSYDAQGNLRRTVDAEGHATELFYDFENRVIRTRLSDGAETRTEYDALGRRTRTFDAKGTPTVYGYDLAGRNTSVTDALGHITQYEYDAAGRKVAMVDALNRRTTYAYDAYDRLTVVTFPNGSQKKTDYDAFGRKIRETDQANKITRFEYDAVGQLTAVVDAMNFRTRYAYDPLGNRISQTDANGHTTTMAYDAQNRMVRKTYPDGATERFTYDAVGNLIGSKKGQDSIAYAYDAMNREIHRLYLNSGHEVTTYYGPTGRRDSVLDYRGMTRFEYDTRGRMVLESLPNGDYIANQYDAQGQRTRVQTPHGLTRYTYDTLGRLDSVIAPNNGITRYFYTAVGSQDSLKRANGTSTRYTYDALNRLTEIRNWGRTGLLSRFTYTLNPAGIRTQVTELGGARVDYGYDDLYRLTSESRNGAAANNYSYAYTYDAVGNRLTSTQGGGNLRQSTYNSRDQLLIEGNTNSSTVYTYDAAGRLRTQSGNGSSLTYHWSDEDRLTGITGGASPIEYTYDFEGRRVGENVGGVTRQYLIDRHLPYGQVVAETDGGNQLVAQFTYGLDRLSQQRNGGTNFYLADGQGSTRQLTDTAAVVTDTWLYSAFGVELARTGTSENRFTYTGEQWDPNAGFYYLRARWMDPGLGRFFSLDSYAGDLQTPSSLHRYFYANASPVNFTDPTGLSTNLNQLIVTMAAAIGAASQAVRAGFQISKSSGGVALRNVGIAVENSVAAILEATSINFTRNYAVFGETGRRIVDFYATAAEKLALIEVKYKLPSRAGEALTRVVNQIKVYGSSDEVKDKGAQVVLFVFKAPTQAEIELLKRQLGPNAPIFQQVQGLGNLANWLKAFSQTDPVK